MHPVIKSLLKMLGIDPDHPEQMLDALANSLGIKPDDFKQLPEKLVQIGMSIDNRLNAVQADIALVKARLEIEDQNVRQPDNQPAAGQPNGSNASASPASGAQILP